MAGIEANDGAGEMTDDAIESATAAQLGPSLELGSGATMPPHEVVEKLRRGEPIERARIVGLKLKGEFRQPVRFSQVTLVDLTIENATFAAEVAFESCTLDRAKFHGAKTSFDEGLSLAGSTLIKPSFRRIVVKKTFRCDRVRCRGGFAADGVRFEARLKFWEAQIQGWMEFQYCEMLEPVDFRSMHVDEGLVLKACRFQADVLCRGAAVHKKLQADESHFEGLLDLSKAKLFDFVYLEGMGQGEKQRFAFTNALAERILIRPAQLEGRLASEEAGDYAQAMQEYGLLKRNFEALHRYEQEDWALYRFKVNQRRCQARQWRRPWTKLAGFCDWLLLDHGCGYGTNPIRAVRAALLIIFGFALIYAVGIDSFNIDPNETPFASPQLSLPQRSLANRLMIGTLTSVSAFTSGFGDIRGAVKGWMNLPLIAESLMGTLLWGLFIVAFSRKVIR